MYRDFEAEEKAVFDHLAKRVPLLEGQLEVAMKLAYDNLDKAVDARKELLHLGEASNKA